MVLFLVIFINTLIILSFKKVRDFFILLIICVIIFFVLHQRPDMDWANTPKEYDFVVIEYYDKYTPDCQKLHHHLHQVAWVMAREPILFGTYDKTSEETLEKSKQSFIKIGFNDILKQNEGLGYAYIFRKKDRKKILKIDKNTPAQEIEKIIKNAMIKNKT